MQLFKDELLNVLPSNIEGAKVYPVKVDIKTGFKGSKQVLFSGGDINTAIISTIFYDGCVKYDISGKKIVANILKPNKNTMSVNGEVVGEYVNFNLGAAGVNQRGLYALDISFMWEDKLVTTPKLYYEVTSPIDVSDSLEEEVNFPILMELIATVDEKVELVSNKIEELDSFKQGITSSIDEYKGLKDNEINQELNSVKETTLKDISNFKEAKSREITEFKEAKSTEITNFKDTKSRELDSYKQAKDLEINSVKDGVLLDIEEFKGTIQEEITDFKNVKSGEIDSYKNEKDKLINAKVTEVNQTKDTLTQQVSQKIVEIEEVKNGFQNKIGDLVSTSSSKIEGLIETADTKVAELVNYDEKLDTLTSSVANHNTRIGNEEYKNKTQDTYLNGLFNEQNDKRLAISGEGNMLVLEGSKEGLVELEGIEGNSLVNLISEKTLTFESRDINVKLSYPLKRGVTYSLFFDQTNSNLPRGFTVSLKSGIDGEPMLNVPIITETRLQLIPPIENLDYLMLSTGNADDVENNRNVTLENIILVEGEAPAMLPFSGLKSSFEECLVTEEDVRDNGELDINLGKYKCEVVVNSKNMFDPEKLYNGGVDLYRWYVINPVGYEVTMSLTEKSPEVDIGGAYTGMSKLGGSAGGGSRAVNWALDSGNYSKPIQSIHRCISVYRNDKTVLDTLLQRYNIQVEIGKSATDYVPFFESKQSLYLTSPLLKGDKLVYKEDGIYHYHKSGKVVIDGSSINTIYDSRFPELILFITYSNVPNIAKGAYREVVCDTLFSYKKHHGDMPSAGITQWSDKSASFTGCLKRSDLVSEDKAGIVQWFNEHPTTVIYELETPYYEKVLDNKFVLDTVDNAILFTNSIVPCKEISARYTGNIPSVYRLEETGITNMVNIEVTQQAVDFILMETVGAIDLKSKNTRGGNANMGAYFASRILKEALKYEDVIRKYPEFKDDIDFILRSEGREDLIEL